MQPFPHVIGKKGLNNKKKNVNLAANGMEVVGILIQFWPSHTIAGMNLEQHFLDLSMHPT